MQHFSPLQLKEYLKISEPLLLDVREAWEFDICALNKSMLIPMGSIPVRMNELGLSQEMVLICHHGIRSRHVGLYLESQGFNNIINLSGGVDAWARDVDLQMATY
ncbi:MAG: sulfurtransferase [Gammaproteobacteria bacterium]|nr:sulfurtransferase [Gammaproteobacteria bacterium]